MLNPGNLTPGQEQHEAYQGPQGQSLVQYDYRAQDGELFSCIAHDLSEARRRCERWLRDRHLANTNRAPEKGGCASCRI
jgi:hypothetical protein